MFLATVLTMFPEAFPGPLGVSLIGSAWRERGLWALETVDIRGHSGDKRGFLDDTPAGGGPGQVLRADVVASALDSVGAGSRPLLYMSARGRPLTQARVKEWAAGDGVVVLCGRFEGVDQRVLDARGFEEIAVGDAVLAGGEAAAMVVVEACVRLVPGVLGRRRRWRRRVSKGGSWSTLSIPGPGSSRGARYPRSCSVGTTRAWRPGAPDSGRRPRGSGVRTSGRRISPTDN
jgi:tRNA (guanine37-N1)-methyltransferase